MNRDCANVRPAAVAGLFYEADAHALRRQVSVLLEGAESLQRVTPRALIVPHAGYIYSGATAAAAYRTLQALRETVTRVLLFGPAHRVYLQGMAVPSVAAFSTPLGDIPLDSESIQRIVGHRAVTVSDEAHRQEHSLEVQLPFLQTVLGDFSLVPVVVGHGDATAVAEVIDALWGGPESVLLISTDLSHFHPYEEARQLDTRTCQRLLAGDDALSGEDACGAHALNGLMRSRRGQSLQMELLDLCNSGDTAGNMDRVVGYGAFSLH